MEDKAVKGFAKLSESDREIVQKVIGLIFQKQYNIDMIRDFIHDQRKKNMSYNSERFRCGYHACLNALEDYIKKMEEGDLNE